MDADDWGLPLVSLQTKQKHFLQVQPNRLFGLVLYFGQTWSPVYQTYAYSWLLHELLQSGRKQCI